MVRKKAYLYFSDMYELLPYSFEKLVESWERGPLCLFSLVRDRVERELGVIKGVKHYGTFIDLKSMIFVVEYMVDYEGEGASGTVGVKIIYADNPQVALMKYYEAEKKGKLIK